MNQMKSISGCDSTLLNQRRTLRNGKVIESKVKSDLNSKDSKVKNRSENVINYSQSSDSETIIYEDINESTDEELIKKGTSEKSTENKNDSNRELTLKYVVSEAKGGFSCGYDNCGKWFRKVFYCKEHIHRHLGLKPYECQYNSCNYRCVARAGMKRHIRDIHKTAKGKTRVNGNQIESDYPIEEIIDKYVKEGYKCGFKDCHKQFKACRDLKTHIKRHLELKPYKCKYQGCDYRCVERRGLRPHIRKSHQTVRGLKCKECSKSMKTRFDLKSHKKSHKEFKCKLCGKLFTRQCYLKEHEKRHTLTKFPCHFQGCQYTGNLMTDLNRHIVNIHHNLSDSIECKECNISFKTKFLYYSHKLKVHKMVGKYKCNKCEKTFVQEYQLFNHKRRHQEYRPHICQVKGCLYEGKMYRDLKRHTENLHRVVSDLKCNLCDIPIETKFQLMTHRVKKHVERHFPCTHCGQTFLAKDVMQRHVNRKHISTENSIDLMN